MLQNQSWNNNKICSRRYIKVESLISAKYGIKDYKLCLKIVGALIGIFKRIYSYNHIPIIGLKRVQNLMFIIIVS